MAENEKAEEKTAWYEEARATYNKIVPLLEGKSDAVIGAVLAPLIAQFITAENSLAEQAALFRDFMKMTVSLMGEMAGADHGEVGLEVYQLGNPTSGITDVTARVRQAISELKAGRFSSMEEAMAAIGAKPVSDERAEELKAKAKKTLQ
jgi:hypothetical protein